MQVVKKKIPKTLKFILKITELTVYKMLEIGLI